MKTTIFLALSLLVLSSTLFVYVVHGDIQGIGEKSESTEMKSNVPTDRIVGNFMENRGQWDDDLEYVAMTSFGSIGLGKSSLYVNLPGEDKNEARVIEYTFPGSNDVNPTGIKPKNHLSNYFYGSDPQNWIRGVRSYESVVYPDLYDDIDLKYHFSETGFKYDLVLKPYANPDDIEIEVKGQRSMDIMKDKITLGVMGGSLQDRDLLTYTEAGHTIIPSEFKPKDKNTYGFELGKYDRSKKTIIDPLIFSTFVGGSGSDDIDMVKKTGDGNLLCVGTTMSTDFPTTDGSYDTGLNGGKDMVVFGMNSDGSDLLFSTYIGGNDDDYTVIGDQIATDDQGNIYLVGSTRSTNFPTSSGAYQTSGGGSTNADGFVLKLKGDGSDLVFSTYLGGSSYESINGDMIVTDEGDVIVGGYTGSEDFPTENALDSNLNGTDIFITRINKDGKSLDFSTYIGGDGSDSLSEFQMDGDGNLLLLGSSRSSDYPVTTGSYQTSNNGKNDLVLTKMRSDGSKILSSTYVGGSDYDSSVSMILDEYDNPIVIGSTGSLNFPVTDDSYDECYSGGTDGVLFKMKSDLSSLTFSTFFGGKNHESITQIDMTPSGEIVVTGTTRSRTYPTTNGAFDSEIGGGSDMFVSKFEGDGSDLIASTLIGGNERETGELLINGVNGKISVCAKSNSSDLRTTLGSFNRSHSGDYDIYYVTLNDDFTGIEYGTYIGGSGSESCSAFLDVGDVYIFGQTESSDFPITEGVFDSSYTNSDSYVLKLQRYNVIEPTEVNSLKVYSDYTCTEETDIADINDPVFIELRGMDGNSTTRDYAKINITFSESSPEKRMILLRETNRSSGVYRNDYRIPVRSVYLERLDFISCVDPSKKARISVEKPYRPSDVDTMELFFDQGCTIPITKCEADQEIYIQLSGSDTDPASKNHAFVNVTGEKLTGPPVVVVLKETGSDSSVYRGSYKIPGNLSMNDELTIKSARDPSVTCGVTVHVHLDIQPDEDLTSIEEDLLYEATYANSGFMEATWSMTTDADWLHWSDENNTLYGVPDNGDVGTWEVNLTVSDRLGHSKTRIFNVEVINTAPAILTEDRTEVDQDRYYEVDYDSDEDGSGSITWFLETNATWLEIDEETGVLSGTPENDHVGIWSVIVSVFDGIDGMGRTVFRLTVNNVNDAPVITTEDITEMEQNEPYRRTYQAEDIDEGDSLEWHFSTDASFLEFEDGLLSGTPGDSDVGTWFVNVTAVDSRGGMDVHNFTLTVDNVNDPPVWINAPEDVEIPYGSVFTYDVNATDVDETDSLTYIIETDPEVDIRIDSDSGVITWNALYKDVDKMIQATVKATDGEYTIEHEFVIDVIPSDAPASHIIAPGDGERVSGDHFLIEWSGEDPDGDRITYDIYMDTQLLTVTNLEKSTRLLHEYEGTSFNMSGLDQGKIYYWTVIPSDHFSAGECTDGILKFEVNRLPRINQYQGKRATAGEDFKLKIKVEDGDQDDKYALRYTLIKSPEGVSLGEDTGVITWKPGSDQEGEHEIVFTVSDGIDTVTGSVDVVVVEAEQEEGSSLNILPVIMGVAALLVVVILVIGFLIIRKQKEIDDTVSDVVSSAVREELEKKREKENEKDNRKKPVSGVPLDFREAHANDRGERDYSHQDLYGDSNG